MIHSVAYGSASKRANQKITDISDLIYDSYSKYGQLTTAVIERLRFKHRIKVVQNLEENSVKNMIRSLQSNAFINHYLTEDQLQEFYSLVKEELLRQQYWGRSSSIVTENVSQPIYENIKLDFDLFKTYFLQMSNWAKGDNAQKLAQRLFRFMDENDDGYLNLLEFLILMVLLLKADDESRLKLFFYIHTIILPNEHVLFELDGDEDGEQMIASALSAGATANENVNEQMDSGEADITGIEIATEATEYIDCMSELEISSTTSAESAELIENVYPRVTVYQILPGEYSKSASPKHSPMHLYQQQQQSGGGSSSSSSSLSQSKRDQDQLAELGERIKIGGLPPLKKEQFIQLWKSLYEMFGQSNDRDSSKLNAIASFGAGLLKMGELAAVQGPPATVTTSTANDSMSNDSFEFVNKSSEASATSRTICRESQWSITFDQFKAQLLIDEHLSAFFERTFDMSQVFAKYRDSRRFDRSLSAKE